MRNKSIISTICACLAAFTFNANASIIYADARGDYVAGINDGDPGILSATGTGTWSYLASDNVNPTLDTSLDTLLWNAAGPGYRILTGGGHSDNVDLANNVAADEIRMHPSASYAPNYVVTRWTAGTGEAGQVNIAGNARMLGARGGNGVTFDIFVDGVSVFNSTIGAYDSTGVSFNQAMTVGVGSTVDFVVGPNSSWDDAYDSTGLKALVNAVPVPASAWLFGSGIIGLIGIARRKAQD